MSTFSKLVGLAKKAAASSSSGSAHGGPGGAGGTDWRQVVRIAADTLTGDARQAPDARTSHPQTPTDRATSPAVAPTSPATPDRAAVARYEYLLRTATPEQIEQVHRDSFARLTPAERAQLDGRLRSELPPHEHPRSSTPDDLARTAARAEASRPGFLPALLARAGGHRSGLPSDSSRGRLGSDSSLGGVGSGGSRGGHLAGGSRDQLSAGRLAAGGLAVGGGLLAAVAGGAVVSAVAAPLLEQAAGLGVDFDALAAGATEATAGLGEQVSGVAGQVSGVGEQVTGVGEQVSNLGSGFTIPTLDDLFGR